MNIFDFKIPIDLAASIIGGIIGLLLVLFWDWLTKPRLFCWSYSFLEEKVEFGILYKIKFKISGLRNPGFCEFQIHWCDNMVRAKWDDLPNPLRNDNLSDFEPSLVPQTFFLPLMVGQEYTVPIIHKSDDENLTIFSGWWFGRRNNLSYGPDPHINRRTSLRLILKGNDLYWIKNLTVQEIIKKSTKR